ncbi:hypothetical protein [Pseudoalteromonas luteoviolacea]|uniref:Uncharacterized protein n=1 Tax=Pseudoalteromonas luteoviolacea S4060-1 TaxID=1365257 RepID=A0A167KV66_9GAMM|nr:hypothetical protein [Pseudoalteromonas luteoviolacea]KZN63331.1 hypothetical protein N478_03515 [Pseudoalteromonas luteoviolacea S4060-1]
MNKINKKQYELIAQLHGELSSNVDEYNSLVKDLNSRLESVISDFQQEHGDKIVSLEADMLSVTEELERLSSEQVKKLDEYISERSDKWYDTDSGIEFQHWLDDWQQFSSDVTKLPSFDCFCGIDVSLDEVITLPSIKK